MPLPRPTALVADPLSSSSLRVLCALQHKGLELPLQSVRLLAGEHHGSAHCAVNPAAAVPVLLLEGGEAISQSLAILEYLEAVFPHPSLIPPAALHAARVRSLCALVAADIHPLTNLRVRQRVAQTAGEAATHDWSRHWSEHGLAALEGWLVRWGGRFSVGDEVTLADFFVVPAIFTMQRLGCPPAPQSRVAGVYRQALELAAFERIRAAGGGA